MRNVRCDGNGDPRRRTVAPAPCGWTGARAPAELAFTDQVRREMETKPCPHCGGQVRVFRHPLTGVRLP